MAIGSSVSQSARCFPGAKAEMPTNYTANDFVLIRLHRRRARTISDLVTSRERVGRSMSPMRLRHQGETEMNTSLNHGSAKIYQFPAGGRAALGGRRYDETKRIDRVCLARQRNGVRRRLVSRGGHPGIQAGAGALMPTARRCRCGLRSDHQSGKRVETKTFRPFFSVISSQAVAGRLACLTVMPILRDFQRDAAARIMRARQRRAPCQRHRLPSICRCARLSYSKNPTMNWVPSAQR